MGDTRCLLCEQRERWFESDDAAMAWANSPESVGNPPVRFNMELVVCPSGGVHLCRVPGLPPILLRGTPSNSMGHSMCRVCYGCRVGVTRFESEEAAREWALLQPEEKRSCFGTPFPCLKKPAIHWRVRDDEPGTGHITLSCDGATGS